MNHIERMADATAEVLQAFVRRAVAGAEGAVERLGFRVAKLERAKAEPGPPGPQGVPGTPGPMGPMPKHEWSGSQLRFQLDKNTWGEFVELRGPRGQTGVVQVGGGGGGGDSQVRWSWFPQGF